MNNRLFFKFAWCSLREWIKGPLRLARLQQEYPTCRFYSGSYVDQLSKLGNYNVIFKNTSLINTTLGDHTFVQKHSIIINADIGKFCSIASSVSISLGAHPSSHVSTHPAFYSVTQPLARTFSTAEDFEPFGKRTTVGNDVWIGQNVIILDGVNVGTGAIVGAGAVVTKDVPEYAIVAGNPVRFLRYRFSKEIREKLIETEWWNMPEEVLKNYYDSFSEPESFIKLWDECKLNISNLPTDPDF